MQAISIKTKKGMRILCPVKEMLNLKRGDKVIKAEIIDVNPKDLEQ